MKTEYYKSSFALLLFLVWKKLLIAYSTSKEILLLFRHISETYLSFKKKKNKKIRQSLIFNFQRNNFQISYL